MAKDTRRKSNAEHKENGTYRPGRHGDFNMPVEIPEAPEHLSDDARKVWDELTQLFYEAGVITRIDKFLVGVLCDSIILYRTAQKEIEDLGMTIVSDNQHGTCSKSNPAIKVRDNCAREIIQILRQYGLTPLARGQRPNTETTDEGAAKLANFLGLK